MASFSPIQADDPGESILPGSPEIEGRLSDPEPLWDAEKVARVLDVSVDWAWDHSTRRAPYLPAIWLSNGALRFRPSKIKAFIDERVLLSGLKRKRR